MRTNKRQASRRDRPTAHALSGLQSARPRRKDRGAHGVWRSCPKPSAQAHAGARTPTLHTHLRIFKMQRRPSRDPARTAPSGHLACGRLPRLLLQLLLQDPQPPLPVAELSRGADVVIQGLLPGCPAPLHEAPHAARRVRAGPHGPPPPAPLHEAPHAARAGPNPGSRTAYLLVLHKLLLQPLKLFSLPGVQGHAFRGLPICVEMGVRYGEVPARAAPEPRRVTRAARTTEGSQDSGCCFPSLDNQFLLCNFHS